MPKRLSRHDWLIIWIGAILMVAAYWIVQARPAGGTPGVERTTRISVSSFGVEGNQGSSYPAVAAISDGTNMHYFVTFSSDADNLVSGDNNGKTDIFVRDLQTNVTRRVSLTGTGAEANGDSWDPALAVKWEGQPCLIIAFASAATNIVTGDTNQATDIFVRDECDNVTERVSVDSSGGQANGLSIQPAISEDGNRVAFSSLATNLEQTNNSVSDVFVHDRPTNETRHISNLSSVQWPFAVDVEVGSWHPAITAAGQFIAYEGLHPAWLDGNDYAKDTIQILVYDWVTGETEVASVERVEQKEGEFVDIPGINDSLKPSIAATTDTAGQPCYLVAFESWDKLVPYPNFPQGIVKDVYIRNGCTQTTGRIVVDRDELEPIDNINSTAPSISKVTRTGSDYSYFVAFQSWALAQTLNTVYLDMQEETDLDKLDSDIYVYFIEPGQDPVVDIVSIDNSDPPNLGGNGDPFRGDSITPVVSADGCFVAFKSRATNLELANPSPIADTNFEVDIFTRSRCDS